MPKFKWSKISKIYKISLFTFLFILLTLFIILKESLAFNNKEKKLRKLGEENACFTIFRIFDYFFYLFLFGSFFAPCACCEEKESNEYKIENRNLAFFLNKTIYIINVGYLIISGVNFINDVEFGYSLSIFIFSLLYFLISSTTYIILSLQFKEKCFPGICQWGYLKKMLTAPCFFFAPCKEKECCGPLLTEEGDCSCPCCCLFCIGILLDLLYGFVYYIGLAFYSLFWLIGKFFVNIGCNDDCWLKEDYNVDTLRFTKSTLDTPLDVSEEREDKKVKKVINKIIPKKTQKKIKQIAKNITKKIEKTEKSIEESES